MRTLILVQSITQIKQKHLLTWAYFRKSINIAEGIIIFHRHIAHVCSFSSSPAKLAFFSKSGGTAVFYVQFFNIILKFLDP